MYLCDKFVELTDGDFQGFRITNPMTEERQPAQGHFEYKYCCGESAWDHYPIDVEGEHVGTTESYNYVLVVRPNRPAIMPGNTVVGHVRYDQTTGALEILIHNNFPSRMDGGGDLSPAAQILHELRQQLNSITQ